MWARPGTTCAYVDDLGRHERYKLTVFVDCSLFTSSKCMTSGRVAG